MDILLKNLKYRQNFINIVYEQKKYNRDIYILNEGIEEKYEFLISIINSIILDF